MTEIVSIERDVLATTGLSSGRMLELGCKKNRTGTYKEQFVSEGWEHVSVDLNGEAGSLPRDLCQRGVLNDLGLFDAVTNFGTSEHVADQLSVWENVHTALKLGGWIVSVTPAPGTWPGHGRHYPYLDWYFALSTLNHYAVRVLGRARDWNLFVGRKDRDARFRLPDSAYMWIEETKRVGNYSPEGLLKAG